MKRLTDNIMKGKEKTEGPDQEIKIYQKVVITKKKTSGATSELEVQTSRYTLNQLV